MKSLHVSTWDVRGGAARAAGRLLKGLSALGSEAAMIVCRRESADLRVTSLALKQGLAAKIRRGLRRWRISRERRPYPALGDEGAAPFTTDRSDVGRDLARAISGCDVVNLQWVGMFLDYRDFFPGVTDALPVVWTLHDVNPLTGGCHCNLGCDRYLQGCGCCPQLDSGDRRDLSASVFRRKLRALGSVRRERLQVVAPSRWLGDMAGRSPLLGRFPVAVIPNALDTEEYQPRERKTAREALGLPADALVLLFVADRLGSTHKGFPLLLDALEGLEERERIWLVTATGDAVAPESAARSLHLPGIRNDRVLSLVYSAADVFVIPSLQDNLPNTVMESMACGTPVVGFDVGGIPDMVRPGETGLLAPAGDTDALAVAIRRMLTDDELRRRLGARCREVAVKEYALEIQARRYVALYEEMLKSVSR